MATLSGYINPNNAYKLTLTITESDINVSANTSKVTVVGTFSRANQYYSAHMPNSTSTVVIDGTSYTRSADVSADDSHVNTQVFSITQTVTHDSTGAYRLPVSWTFNGNVPSSYNPNGTVSGTVELTAIPRSSVPSTDVQTLTVNGTNSVVITTNRRSTSYTHDISASVDGTHTYTIAQGVTVSTTWTVPTSIIADFPANSMSATCTITCVTYADGSVLGTATCTMTLMADGAIAGPSVTVSTITETDSGTYPGGSLATIEGTGFIEGYSKPRIAVNASSAWGATIASVRVNNGVASYDCTLSGGTWNVTMLEPGRGTLTITATDSRGLTATITQTITVTRYDALTISTATAERPNPDLDDIAVYIYGRFTQAVGSNTNAITTSWSYTPKGGSETVVGAFSVTEYANYYTSRWTTTVLDKDTIYTAKFTLTDALTSVSVEIPVYKSTPVFSFGVNGRMGQDNHFDIFGDLNLHDETNPANCLTLNYASVFGLTAETIFPVGSVYMTTSNADLSNWLGLRWELQSEGQYIMSAGSTYGAGSNGGYTLFPVGSDNPSATYAIPTTANSQATGYQNRMMVTSLDNREVSDFRPPYLAVKVWVRVAGSVVTHSITNTLTNVSNSNSATQVTDGDAYVATLTPDSGYLIDSVQVTMDGVDITSQVFTGTTE